MGGWPWLTDEEASSLLHMLLISDALFFEAMAVVYGDPDINRVIKAIAEQCESGGVSCAYRSVTGGAEDLRREVWRMPHWRSYFANGTIDLDLPVLDDKLRPVLDGRSVRCTREIFVRRGDLQHFLASLTSSHDAKHRYAGDSKLIEEGRRLVAQGMSKRRVARKLAPSAEGGTIEQREERRRKLL